MTDLLRITIGSLSLLAKELTVIVPSGNRTGCSAAISLNTPIEIRPSQRLGNTDIWTTSGLPNDGVRYAMRKLCPDASAVISGINDGWNLGYSVINSGTIGAAMEGVRFGKHGLALSAPFGFRLVENGAAWQKAVGLLVAELLSIDEVRQFGPVVLNVNLPEAFSAGGPLMRVLDVSRVHYEEWYEFQPANARAPGSVVLRGQRMKPDADIEDLRALGAGMAVINVLPTPWTMNEATVRAAIQSSRLAS